MADAGDRATRWQPLSRRDRVRADTVREIKQTARRVLVDQGVDGLALRAVAREMGMTAPALYRYFDSREDLVEHVVADLYDELTDVLEAARDAADPRPPRRPAAGGQPRVPALGDHAPRRVRRCCSAARGRAWSRRRTLHGTASARRRSPASGSAASSPRSSRGSTWSRASRCRPTTSSSRRCRSSCARGAPSCRSRCRSASCSVFLSCWIRLYGMVCMEVFGHLRFALRRRRADVRGRAAQPGRGARRGRRVPAAVRLTWRTRMRDEAHC